MPVPRDSVIVRQGEPADTLYMVQSGRVRCVMTDAAGREHVLEFYTDGQSFGELGLLTGEMAQTTMQAVSDCKLLTLRKDDFDGFLAQNVQLMLLMMKVAADRQAATTVRLARSEGTTAAVSPGGAGKVFTVFSPKGGVGKTTVAVNLAVALAHAHAETVALVDLSLTFGHCALLLNLVPVTSLASTTADAFKGMGVQENLSYYLTVHPSSTLRLLAGSMRPEEGEAVTGEAAKAAIEQLRKYFSYIVVDTSCTFSDPVLAALEASDRVLLLCTPEMSVLRDVRECQKILRDVLHLAPDKLHFLMNDVCAHKGLSREQFEEALQQPLYMDLPNGGDVPLRASLRGEALVEKHSGSNVARAIQKLATQLVSEVSPRGPVQEKKRGFFR